MNKTYFTFFGVRGSYPVSDESVKKYGGNTSSLLIENDNDIIIFDAGTGIIKLGEYIKNERKDIKNINIFISHFHLDHLMGISFFYPFSNKKYKIKIYFPEIDGSDMKSVISNFFEPPYSPIGIDGISADVEFIGLDIRSKNKVSINNNININYYYDPLHPLHGVMLYKLRTKNKSLVFATDIEPEEKFADELKKFIKGSDVLIHDSQYLDEDYYNEENPTKGYGHSTFTMAANNAVEADVGKLYLFHHNPTYPDSKLEKILKEVKKKFKNSFLSKENEKNEL